MNRYVSNIENQLERLRNLGFIQSFSQDQDLYWVIRVVPGKISRMTDEAVIGFIEGVYSQHLEVVR